MNGSVCQIIKLNGKENEFALATEKGLILESVSTSSS